MSSTWSSSTRRLWSLSRRAAGDHPTRIQCSILQSLLRQDIEPRIRYGHLQGDIRTLSSSPSNAILSQSNSSDKRTSTRRTLKRTSTSKQPTPPRDYQTLAMDRIVLNEDYASIDTAEAEANLQRLAFECIDNPNAPNLLLNMLEMMHNEQAQVSSETRLQIFKQVVQSKHVKLLEKAEDLVVWNYRQDRNLLRLIVVGYVHADAPERACQLLLQWPKSSSSYPPPTLQSYRLVLTALSKKGDYQRAFLLLQHLCQGYPESSEHPTSASSTGNGHNVHFPTPDEDCFHKVLIACDKSEEETFSTAQQVLRLMTSYPLPLSINYEHTAIDHTNYRDMYPTNSAIRLFLKAWAKSKNPNDRRLLQQNAFDWLREMESVKHNQESTLTTKTIRQSPTAPDIQCYNILINALAEDGNYQEAEALLKRILTDYVNGLSKVQPDDITFHTVLKAHLHAATKEAAEAAEQLVQRIDNFARRRDQILIKRKKDTGKQPPAINDDNGVTRGDEETTEEQDTAKAHLRFADLQPTARAYATVIALWLKLERPDRALTVLDRAEVMYRHHLTKGLDKRNARNHLRLDIICYRNIVTALSRAEYPSAEIATQAQEVVRKMVRVGHSPDLHTCNAVLSCWIKVGQPNEAEEFLEKTMKQDLGMRPDIISYNTVIHGHCTHGELERALEILEKLLTWLSSESILSSSFPNPNTRTFTSILTALAKQKTYEATKQAEALVLQMQDLHESHQLDTRPNVFSYNAVLNCWASLSQRYRGSSQEYGRRAEEILMSMKGLTKDEQPSVSSYNTVIKGYRDDVVTGEKLVRDMVASGLHPNEKTWETLMYILKHDNRFKNKEEKAAELRKGFFSHLNGTHNGGRAVKATKSSNRK